MTDTIILICLSTAATTRELHNHHLYLLQSTPFLPRRHNLGETNNQLARHYAFPFTRLLQRTTTAKPRAVVLYNRFHNRFHVRQFTTGPKATFAPCSHRTSSPSPCHLQSRRGSHCHRVAASMLTRPTTTPDSPPGDGTRRSTAQHRPRCQIH